MNRHPKIVAEFINEYEEKRVIHRDPRGRLCLRRNRELPAQALSKAVSSYAGAKIRDERRAQGISLEELAKRAGLTPTKQRMREIEVNQRSSGMRIGTLYCLARALGKQPWDFLPDTDAAFESAGVRNQSRKSLAVA